MGRPPTAYSTPACRHNRLVREGSADQSASAILIKRLQPLAEALRPPVGEKSPGLTSRPGPAGAPARTGGPLGDGKSPLAGAGATKALIEEPNGLLRAASSAKWHATSCPSLTCKRGGSSRRQISWAMGQRVWNLHPGGGASELGTSPATTARWCSRLSLGSAIGTAEKSACV